MRKLSEALYLIALTAWVGGHWTVGYLVAPVLFDSLGNRQLAGMVAGKLFALISWFGLGVAAYLVVFLAVRWGKGLIANAVFRLVLIIALLTMVSLFGVQPMMAQLKIEALPLDVMESALRDRFVTLHRISSILYMAQSLLGMWLVVWSGRGLR